MKNLLWKFRCARHLNKRAMLGWKMSWEIAGSLLESVEYDLTENPIDVADDDLSYWRD